MIQEPVTALALAREIQRACARATTLRSALEGLLEVVELEFGPQRAFAIGRVDGHTEIAGGASTGGAQDVQEALDRFEDRASARVLPFGTDSFTGALILDVGTVEPWTEPLSEALRETAPAFARMAELEGLHSRVAETEEKLRHLNTISDALPDPVVVLDSDDWLFMANRRAERLFHSNPDDSPGRRRAVQANNLFFSAFRARSMLGEDDAADRELVLADPEDGSDLLYEVQAVRGELPEGQESKTIYILRDITDLKRATVELETHYRRLLSAEHRLRRETDRLNVIIENAGIPILVTDAQSDIVLLNREAERLFEVEDAGSAWSMEFRPMRSNDAALTGLISDFLLQPLTRREEEVELVEPGTNRQFPARVTFTKITSSRGEPIAVVSVVHDLTSEAENQALAEELRTLNTQLEERVESAVQELAERNRQLEEQREELAMASRLKTEFVAMMSHELRTPLNSIMGYSSLLSEGLLGELNPEQSRALDKTRQASEHLLSLINDILDLSKVEAGKMALTLEEVPVARFARDLAEGVRHLFEDAPVEFRTLVEDDVPPIRADRTRLHQVLLNLVTNSAKFTDEGFVELRCRLDDSGEAVLFEVEDTGVGIKADHLEVIFEGFRQLEEFPTREQKGSGLGLAISRRLVEMMGGKLQVRSTYGEGSTFWFTVPVATEFATDPPAADGGREKHEDTGGAVAAIHESSGTAE